MDLVQKDLLNLFLKKQLQNHNRRVQLKNDYKLKLF